MKSLSPYLTKKLLADLEQLAVEAEQEKDQVKDEHMKSVYHGIAVGYRMAAERLKDAVSKNF
ncbi:hypothetical protein NCCP2716_23210 [Sporosarcina sp. NCCP-2716]|uniref:hypothetical protein n=1 Tax=Sporosarcina sp. NCCP-2716 TaxID=2943679 RepID=UPI00203BD63A|nr:hypothetical protein [Sporosarcina sp. NCCP-2716]GKV69823.1 hypothetical protein NCCP2716_23210 [Sporosarcina sp. NCCP-2716]